MTIPTWLRASDLKPGRGELPRAPFFLAPRDRIAVDGDTFAVLGGRDGSGKRGTSFRIRLASIDTPERSKDFSGDRILRRIGIDPHPASPGDQAMRRMQSLVDGRVILVEPEWNEGSNADHYGRLLARVSVSGSVGKGFDLRGAFDLERRLVEIGHARILPGKSLVTREGQAMRSLKSSLLAAKMSRNEDLSDSFSL
jgi:endonuclease YncB( thermonuclease family)